MNSLLSKCLFSWFLPFQLFSPTVHWSRLFFPTSSLETIENFNYLNGINFLGHKFFPNSVDFKKFSTREIFLAALFTQCELGIKGIRLSFDMVLTKAVALRFSIKELLFKILQNSQENTCDEVSFLFKSQAEVLQLY